MTDQPTAPHGQGTASAPLCVCHDSTAVEPWCPVHRPGYVLVPSGPVETATGVTIAPDQEEESERLYYVAQDAFLAGGASHEDAPDKEPMEAFFHWWNIRAMAHAEPAPPSAEERIDGYVASERVLPDGGRELIVLTRDPWEDDVPVTLNVVRTPESHLTDPHAEARHPTADARDAIAASRAFTQKEEPRGGVMRGGPGMESAEADFEARIRASDDARDALDGAHGPLVGVPAAWTTAAKPLPPSAGDLSNCVSLLQMLGDASENPALLDRIQAAILWVERLANPPCRAATQGTRPHNPPEDHCHHPDCEDEDRCRLEGTQTDSPQGQKKRVLKFDHDAPNHPLVVDASGLDAVFEEISAAFEYGEAGDKYTVEMAEMEEAEFDALPEWDGW